MSFPSATPSPSDFDIQDFLPYLLNMSAEATSQGFRSCYKDRYGMNRPEWRVLFHLGRYGPLTAREICDRSMTHKTKISRAVRALKNRRLLTRVTIPQDRRSETLHMTRNGQAAYDFLCCEAEAYDATLKAKFTAAENRILRHALRLLSSV